MLSSGIDCEKYKAHSVTSASTSEAKNCQIPIQESCALPRTENTGISARRHKHTTSQDVKLR